MTKPYLLQKLRGEQVVELFFDNCGEVTHDEIYNLILEDKKYPFKKFLAQKNSTEEFPKVLTPELK